MTETRTHIKAFKIGKWTILEWRDTYSIVTDTPPIANTGSVPQFIQDSEKRRQEIVDIEAEYEERNIRAWEGIAERNLARKQPRTNISKRDLSA